MTDPSSADRPMPLCECGHRFEPEHGDRAVTACMGGWHTSVDALAWAAIKARATGTPGCPCQGYKARRGRRRKAA